MRNRLISLSKNVLYGEDDDEAVIVHYRSIMPWKSLFRALLDSSGPEVGTFGKELSSEIDC